MWQPNPQIRLRRLKADRDAMVELAQRSPLISFDCRGDPPNQYLVRYRCKGAVLDGTRVRVSDRHSVEIFLHANYPMCAPKFKLRTPMFHPNFKYGDPELQVCIEAKNWTPAESLADLVLRIGNMIVFRNYNPKNPLDADAARWATDNSAMFPLDDRPWFATPDDLIEILEEELPPAPADGSVPEAPTKDADADADEPLIEILPDTP